MARPDPDTPGSLEALKQEVKQRCDLAAVIGRYVKLKRRGREYVGLSPFQNERTPSFTVVPDKGFYHCFSSGAHGDVIAFVMAVEGIDFAAALHRLAIEAGITEGTTPPPSRAAIDRQEARREAQRRRERAAKRTTAIGAWRAGRPAAGSPVEGYLQARGLGTIVAQGLPKCLRYHPQLPYWHDGRVLFTGPAMLAAILGPDRRADDGSLTAGGFRALHITWIAPDGSGKRRILDPKTGEPLAAKKIHGPYMGGAIRFAAPGEIFSGRVLGIAEGIETALSARLLQGAGAHPVWAAASLSNIAGGGREEPRRRRHPELRFADGRTRWLPSMLPDLARPGVALPASVEEVVLYADNDSKDPPSFECQIARAVARWQAEGRRVLVARPPEGLDWNDVLLQRANKEAAA